MLLSATSNWLRYNSVSNTLVPCWIFGFIMVFVCRCNRSDLFLFKILIDSHPGLKNPLIHPEELILLVTSGPKRTPLTKMSISALLSTSICHQFTKMSDLSLVLQSSTNNNRD